jgi:hypothetical protein
MPAAFAPEVLAAGEAAFATPGRPAISFGPYFRFLAFFFFFVAVSAFDLRLMSMPCARL